MQLQDEVLEYRYTGALAPTPESWTPLAEVQAKNLLSPARLRSLLPVLNQAKSQVASEREFTEAPAELRPLDAGFIMLPQTLLDAHRRKGAESELGRILARAQQLRDEVDRVVMLGVGGSYLGARALFESLCSTHHNELPPRTRLGAPRIYFEGTNFDTDSLQDLLDLFEATCVDPDVRDERWGAIVVSKSGTTLETATTFRILRNEVSRFYGSKNGEALRRFLVPITGNAGRLRDLLAAEGFGDKDILTLPENVGGRFCVFTAAGLLPAAVLGLDVRALLLGAATMTRRFLEEPFERNPVLQFAAINYLLSEELDKTTRVLAVWSRKLESLGLWYDQLVAESLGKQGRGPTPVTTVLTRDLHSRGQQQQDGRRDVMINNLLVQAPKSVPLSVGMADHNEDDLNQFSRRTLSDMLRAAHQGTSQAYADVGRPSADLVLPSISEFTIGQLMQMFMLATVIEGRLMGINPYGQPGVDAYKRNMRQILQAMPNPRG
jgi:glucose-6-phosphate isomerase